MGFFEDNIQMIMLLIVVLLILVLLVLFIQKRNEFFDVIAEQEKTKKTEVKQEDIDVPVQAVLPDVRTLEASEGYIRQKEVLPAWGQEVYGSNEGLDDGAGGEMGLNNNLCSPSCCSEQWPTPHKLPKDKFVCDNKSEFVPNTYTCNNAWQNSGCLCLTKEQHKFLYNRGGNA
jgi:hypothetical protein